MSASANEDSVSGPGTNETPPWLSPVFISASLMIFLSVIPVISGASTLNWKLMLNYTLSVELIEIVDLY